MTTKSRSALSNFETQLNMLHHLGIRSKKELADKQTLYLQFWFAVRDFVEKHALLSKTSKIKSGKYGSGNIGKIEYLERSGICERSDVIDDCTIRIIDKLDLILTKPLSMQKDYCFTICNNVVNDLLRKYCSKEADSISIDTVIKVGKSDSDTDTTLADIIGNNALNPEEIYFAKLTVRERMQMEQEQRKRALVCKQAAILKELPAFAKHPSEAMARIACVHLGKKPGKLADMILQNGVQSTFRTLITQLSKQYTLDCQTLFDFFKASVSEDDFKAQSKDKKVIAAQVSRLNYRAAKRLEK